MFLTTSAVPGAEVVPVARRRKASRVKLGKAVEEENAILRARVGQLEAEAAEVRV